MLHSDAANNLPHNMMLNSVEKCAKSTKCPRFANANYYYMYITYLHAMPQIPKITANGTNPTGPQRLARACHQLTTTHAIAIDVLDCVCGCIVWMVWVT